MSPGFAHVLNRVWCPPSLVMTPYFIWNHCFLCACRASFQMRNSFGFCRSDTHFAIEKYFPCMQNARLRIHSCRTFKMLKMLSRVVSKEKSAAPLSLFLHTKRAFPLWFLTAPSPHWFWPTWLPRTSMWFSSHFLSWGFVELLGSTGW